MNQVIEHSGTVLSVRDGKARVRISQASACSACHAREMCMSAESKVKELDAEMSEPMEAGDEVVVMVQERMGWKAVVIAYVGPFVVLMALVAGLTWAGWSEAWAGTAALAGTGVYFLLLRCFRSRLQRQFSFTVRKPDNPL